MWLQFHRKSRVLRRKATRVHVSDQRRSHMCCRIAAPLTHELALTPPHWRECLRPIAARLAQIFRESLVNKGAAPRTLAVKSGNRRRSVPGPERSPLLAKPRGRGRTQRAHGARQASKAARPIQPRARCPVSRY